MALYILGTLGCTMSEANVFRWKCRIYVDHGITFGIVVRKMVSVSNQLTLYHSKINFSIYNFFFINGNSDYSNYAYSGYYKILTPAINLHDPDLIKDVLIKDHFSFHVNEQYFSKRFDPLMTYNPFVATDDTWRRARSILTPLLTLYKVRSLHPLIMDSCDKLVGFLRKQPPNKDIEAKTVSRQCKKSIFLRIFQLKTDISYNTKLLEKYLNFP